MTFAVRRAGVHLGRLALIAVVIALVVTGIGGITAVADRMLQAGATQMLTDAEPGARTVRILATQASDAAAQDAAVTDAIADIFAGTDVVVARQAAVETALAPGGDGEPSIRLLDDDRVIDLATLTAGEWPQAAGQIALPVAAADRIDLRLGDMITLDRDGTVLTLVGTWTADDPIDPAWHGDPAVASGENDGAIGPAVVAAGALDGLASTPTITWEIAPRGVELADLPRLQHALDALEGLPEQVDPRRQTNTRIIGGLADTLHREASAISATRGLLIAPQLIIGLLGALVLGTVLVSLSTARREETTLLRSRGASARRLAFSAAAESALFAAVGALLALIGLVLSVGVTAVALVIAGGAVVATVIAGGIVVLRTATRADLVQAESRRSDAGLRTLPALLIPAVVAVALAALAGWQLFATRSVVRPDGSPDPLAAAAPALLLVAACALVPVAAGPLAAVAERLLRRTRGIAPILPLRQIARRMGGVAVAILCLALAAAAVAMAVAAPSASTAAEYRIRVAALGGDVRMIAEDGLDIGASAALAWDEVTDAVEVLRRPLTVGTDEVTIVIAPADVLGPAADALGAPATRSGDVPTVITRSLADRIDAHEGTEFTARIRSVGTPVTFEIARVVDALPGVGDGWGTATTPEALSAIGVGQTPNELWLDSDDPAVTASRLRAEATNPVQILTLAQVSAEPVTRTAPAMLAVGALVAAVLGVIGFIAAISASSRTRRDEAFVLHALGLRPTEATALRIGETVAIVVYAVLAGFALGVVVAGAVLPIVLGVAA